MKNNMKSKTLVVSVGFLILSLLLVSPASALITGNSSSSEPLKDYAYITQSSAAASLSNRGIFTSGDETKPGMVTFTVTILIGLLGFKIAEHIVHDSKQKKDGFLFP